MYYIRNFPGYLGKKSNTVSVYKKGEKNIIDNYKPNSSLPMKGKVFEKIIFILTLSIINENNLLSENQLGPQPSNSSEYQLLSIVHDI